MLPMFAALALAGCGLHERYEAADGVRDFLEAVRTDNREEFEARIDRTSLRRSAKAQLGRLTERNGDAGMLRGVLESEAGDQAIDAMIRPDTFRMAMQRSGLPLDRTPSAAEITPLIRTIDADNACVQERPGEARCILFFRRDGEIWKLVDITPGRPPAPDPAPTQAP